MQNPRRPTFQDLRVWQSALALAEGVYRETASFPIVERYGLTSQMRRCAVSVVANIAEGKGRIGARQFAAFLDIAHGSLRELQALVALSTRLGFLTENARTHLDESISLTVGRLLKLAQRVRQRANPARATSEAMAVTRPSSPPSPPVRS